MDEWEELLKLVALPLTTTTARRFEVLSRIHAFEGSTVVVPEVPVELSWTRRQNMVTFIVNIDAGKLPFVQMSVTTERNTHDCELEAVPSLGLGAGARHCT